MKNKHITIDDLAVMVKNGFENTATKEQFLDLQEDVDILQKRFTNLESEVKIIRKHQIAHTIYRDEFEKLEDRVKELENMLGSIAKK